MAGIRRLLITIRINGTKLRTEFFNSLSQKQTSAHATRWPSGHVQLTKFKLSDGCGGKSITMARQFEYYRHEF